MDVYIETDSRILSSSEVLSQAKNLLPAARVGESAELLELLRRGRRELPGDLAILLEYVAWLRAFGMNREALRELDSWLRSHNDLDASLQKLGVLRRVGPVKAARKLAAQMLGDAEEHAGIINAGLDSCVRVICPGPFGCWRILLISHQTTKICLPNI